MPNQHKNHRPPHLYNDNTFYFITGAILNHQPLLRGDSRKRLFIKNLERSLELFEYLLYAWIILDNHYHIIIKTLLGEKLPFFITKLHSSTGLALNKLDNTVGRQTFYQYWDYCLRSSQDDPYKDLFTHINYLHINPIKHNYLKVGDGVLIEKEKQIIVPPDKTGDLNMILKQYHFSSFNGFLKKYGEEAMNDLWLRYPVTAGMIFDEFGNSF